MAGNITGYPWFKDTSASRQIADNQSLRNRKLWNVNLTKILFAEMVYLTSPNGVYLLGLG
jgi:hypothetical protein